MRTCVSKSVAVETLKTNICDRVGAFTHLSEGVFLSYPKKLFPK